MDRVTRENFAKITLGMTEQEVEAILGPPGKYGGPTYPGIPHAFPRSSKPGAVKEVKYWEGKDGKITIGFDDGFVIGIYFDDASGEGSMAR